MSKMGHICVATCQWVCVMEKNAIDLKVGVPIMKKQFRAKCEVNLNGGKYIFENSFTSILLELTL